MGKVIAVIDKPQSCEVCYFGVCKYSTPLSSCRKGYYCQLQPYDKRTVADFDVDDEVHLDNCPLLPMPDRKILDDWITCLDQITKGS